MAPPVSRILVDEFIRVGRAGGLRSYGSNGDRDVAFPVGTQPGTGGRAAHEGGTP